MFLITEEFGILVVGVVQKMYYWNAEIKLLLIYFLWLVWKAASNKLFRVRDTLDITPALKLPVDRGAIDAFCVFKNSWNFLEIYSPERSEAQASFKRNILVIYPK